MPVMKSVAAAAALVMFLVFPVHALDGPTVDRWMDAMKELNEWGDRQPEAMDEDMTSMDDPQNLDMQQLMADMARQHSEVQAILRRHGFDDSNRWAEISGRIFSAFYALQMQAQSPEMQQQMAEALREIDQSPHLDEAQKAQMRAAMKQQMAIMAEAVPDVPEGDLQAVRSREDALRALFE